MLRLSLLRGTGTFAKSVPTVIQDSLASNLGSWRLTPVADVTTDWCETFLALTVVKPTLRVRGRVRVDASDTRFSTGGIVDVSVNTFRAFINVCAEVGFITKTVGGLKSIITRAAQITIALSG